MGELETLSEFLKDKSFCGRRSETLWALAQRWRSINTQKQDRVRAPALALLPGSEKKGSYRHRDTWIPSHKLPSSFRGRHPKLLQNFGLLLFREWKRQRWTFYEMLVWPHTVAIVHAKWGNDLWEKKTLKCRSYNTCPSPSISQVEFWLVCIHYHSFKVHLFFLAIWWDSLNILSNILWINLWQNTLGRRTVTDSRPHSMKEMRRTCCKVFCNLILYMVVGNYLLKYL